MIGVVYGIILVEAMSAGAPVLASDLDAFAQVLDQGEAGELFTNENPEALAAAAVRLLRDPARGGAMAAHGRERAQHFRWDRVSQRVLSYYERLIYERRLIERSSGGLTELESIRV